MNKEIMYEKKELIDVSNGLLPIQVNNAILTDTFKKAREKDSKVLVVVTGTKPDFYKQAPLVRDAVQASGTTWQQSRGTQGLPL